jgi:Fic family protein
MARIRIVESVAALLQTIQPEQFLPLMGQYGPIDPKGRYLHWNDFKWRVKSGDDELAAWLATKLARRAITQTLPLETEGEQFFSYCLPSSLVAKLHAIDQLTLAGQGSNGTTLTSGSDKNLYLVKSLMQEEAILSSQLEGASTTREIAKELLNKNLPPQDKSQRMIVNNYLLMQKAIEGKDEELSIEFILDLHAIATREAIENSATPGELRQDNNIIVSDLYNDNPFYPPDWQSLKYRLNQLCDFANRAPNSTEAGDFIHPIIKAITLHFMLAYIHPFGDGNGRTARAIFYWSMLRSGYWIFEYVSISKFIREKRGAYDKAFVYTETDDFDITYFLYNQMETIEKAVKGLYAYIDKKRLEFYEFMNWVDNSPVAQTLKRPHLEILKQALKTPGRGFIAKQVANDLGVSEPTARKYLNKLVEQDMLVVVQSQTNNIRLYIAPADLEARMRF